MIPNKISSRFNLFLIFSFFFIIGCTSTGINNTTRQKDTNAIDELKQKVLQQEVLLKRMQKLASDQILLSSELEQSIPPQDLLESMQNGFVELREYIRALEEQITRRENNLTTVDFKLTQIPKPDTNHFYTLHKQDNTNLGLTTLPSANPDHT